MPGSVAQLVERTTENRKVTGSTPVGATAQKAPAHQRGGLLHAHPLVERQPLRCPSGRFPTPPASSGRSGTAAGFAAVPDRPVDGWTARNRPVEGDGAAATVGVMTAEPNQHQSPDAGGQPLQRILMWEGYETLIRDGSKRQTVRGTRTPSSRVRLRSCSRRIPARTS